MNHQPFTTDFLNSARRNDLYAAAEAVRVSRIEVGSTRTDILRQFAAAAAARLLAVKRAVTHKAPVAAGR